MFVINIVICDDEAAQVEFLSGLVRDWAKECGAIVNITSYASAEGFLVGSDELSDILLLDIQMGEMDGMALAKHIRRGNSHVQFIFITGFTDYMSEGFEVDALHYLIKPIKKEQLFSLLTKAAGRLGKEEAVLLVQTKENNVRVKHKDIRYVEAFAHYVVIALGDSQVEARGKISELEEALKEGFVRCHRSYIVGLRHVSRITKTEVVLDGGQVVPLSRRLYNEVNRAFIGFHMGIRGSV